MWTKLVAAVAALAAVFSVWWVVEHDDRRSLGEVTVLVVADPSPVILETDTPPGGSSPTPVGDASAEVGACSGITTALSPSSVVEWSSVTQANGFRACRWSRTWRLADLLVHRLDGEPHVTLADGTIVVTLDPLMPRQGVGISSFVVTVTFPGDVVAHTGAGSVSGTTVEWANPGDFFAGVALSASGRDRPLFVALLPWVAGLLAVASLVAALPWSRIRRSQRRDSGADADAHPAAPSHQPQTDWVPSTSSSGAAGAKHVPAARPAGPDPESPWRPPTP